MKLTAFLSCAFFAAGICAAANPPAVYGVERLVHRAPSSRRLFQRSVIYTRTIDAAAANPTEVTPNWAGAVLPEPPAGDTFTLITAMITVPAAGGAGTSVVVWVGFDGDDGEPPLIQGGIEIFVEDDGTTIFQSWTEWIPDLPVFYDQTILPFQTGDNLKLKLTTQAGQSVATLVIENTTNGAVLTKTFSPSDNSNVAKGLTVEWVVERVEGTTLSNFGTITFSSASASTANTAVDLTGATALEMETGGRNPIVIVTSSITDAFTVVVTYTGP